MTAPTTSPEAEAYLAAVDLELVDLPGDERRELLDDLALHLAELDDDADVTSFEGRLGSPSDYARELRDAAGLPARTTVGRRRHAIAHVAARASGSRIVRETRAFLPQLRPSWWVLRGYLVVLLPCLRDVTGARDFPVPAPKDSHILGGVLVLAAVALSVALGHRRLPRAARVVVVAANVALVVAAVGFLSDAPQRLTRYQVVVRSGPDPLATSPLVSRHGLVTNVLPYAADGTPLEGVLLYDQDGRPLQVGIQQWWADHCKRLLTPPRAVDGIPVPNSYPQQYLLDPSGSTLSGLPVTAGQCKAALTRPKVTVPILPKR